MKTKKRSPAEPSGRSWELKFLILLYLLIGLAGLQRLVSALQTWDFLTSLLPFSPIYLVLSGLFWALLGMGLVIWLWLNLRRSLAALVSATALVAVSYWAERLLLFRNGPAQVNLPFAITTTILALVFITAVILSPNQRRMFFNKKDTP